MNINVIIRIDDISSKFDFYDLKKWFVKHFPEIPVCFYAQSTQLKYMWQKAGWKKIKKTILKYKWEVGGHTRNHSHLKLLSEKDLKEDIEKNVKDIEIGLKSVGLNYKVTSFAYPYGEFNEEIKIILKSNGIFFGLTYVKGEVYETLLTLPKDLHEIGISCNATNSIEDWNKRFKEVYEKGDLYILCLHTPHWSRGNLFLNFKRIIKAKTLKCLYVSIKRFKNQFKVKNSKFMWQMLEEHIKFIKTHSGIRFTTFKLLFEPKNK